VVGAFPSDEFALQIPFFLMLAEEHGVKEAWLGDRRGLIGFAPLQPSTAFGPEFAVLAVERSSIAPDESSKRPALVGGGWAIVSAMGLVMLVWPRASVPRRRGRAPAARRVEGPRTSRASPPPSGPGPADVPASNVERATVMADAPAPAPRPFFVDVPADPVTAYWRLSQPAFDNSPNPKFLYLSSQHEEALVRQLYAVQYRKGFAILTGEYGCGKTTVSRALIERLGRETYDIALLANPTGNVIEFLREVLYQCGVETAATNKSELLHQIDQVLVKNLRDGRSTVIMIDEAQLIDDPAVLEEIRLLLNFQTNDQFLMTLVLIGTLELERRVGRLPHLKQRVAVRARIDPLNLEDTGAYVAHRLRVAGRQEPVFTPGAVARIFEASGGRPRVINNLCELSMVTGCVRRLSELDEAVVAATAHEIELSDPSPTSESPARVS
jgi:type II secretory pathway predicted ATPase ExeA